MVNKIKEFRKAKNIKLIDMSNMLGVTRQTYANYESGDFEPSFETLIKISKILKTSIDELLDNPFVSKKEHPEATKIISEIKAYLDKFK